MAKSPEEIKDDLAGTYKLRWKAGFGNVDLGKTARALRAAWGQRVTSGGDSPTSALLQRTDIVSRG